MPNIIAELIVQLARVQELTEKMSPNDPQLGEAKNLLRYGREQMAMNSYEGMRDALDDLKEFGNPPAETKK